MGTGIIKTYVYILILKACSLVMAGQRIEDGAHEVEKNSNLLATTIPTSSEFRSVLDNTDIIFLHRNIRIVG